MEGNKVIEKARTFLGRTDGSFFNEVYYGKKQKTVYAWCCMFVWYVFHLLGYDNIFYGGKKCAGCTTLLNFYKINYPQFVDDNIDNCREGDLVFFQFDDDFYADHIGIFEKRLTGTSFSTIEGNTILYEGGKYGVYNKTRHISSVMAFVHLPYTLGQPNNEDAENNDIIHTVVKGDTLWGLAKKYYGKGIKYIDIMKYNNLKSTVIRIGQVLKIKKGD